MCESILRSFIAFKSMFFVLFVLFIITTPVSGELIPYQCNIGEQVDSLIPYQCNIGEQVELNGVVNKDGSVNITRKVIIRINPDIPIDDNTCTHFETGLFKKHYANLKVYIHEKIPENELKQRLNFKEDVLCSNGFFVEKIEDDIDSIKIGVKGGEIKNNTITLYISALLLPDETTRLEQNGLNILRELNFTLRTKEYEYLVIVNLTGADGVKIAQISPETSKYCSRGSESGMHCELTVLQSEEFAYDLKIGISAINEDLEKEFIEKSELAIQLSKNEQDKIDGLNLFGIFYLLLFIINVTFLFFIHRGTIDKDNPNVDKLGQIILGFILGSAATAYFSLGITEIFIGLAVLAFLSSVALLFRHTLLKKSHSLGVT